MPEEKVSRPFGETLADIRNSYVQTAADAGPRQPATVGYDGPSRPIVSQGMRMFSVSEFIKGKWTSFADEEQVAQALANGLNAAAAPVPQEVAPSDETEGEALDNLPGMSTRELAARFPTFVKPLTADQEAERIVANIACATQWGELREEDSDTYRTMVLNVKSGLDRYAALIREAGSEREREVVELCAKWLEHEAELINHHSAATLQIAAKGLRASRLLGGDREL